MEAAGQTKRWPDSMNVFRQCVNSNSVKGKMLTTDDLKGLPHVVIMEGKDRIEVCEFEGDDAMERAHEFAALMMLPDTYHKIIVAARVRTLKLHKQE